MSVESARRLRRDMTNAERTLWRYLRDRQLGNTKFRRQHPFGPYVLDFYCEDRRLVIELDGGQHADPEHARRDAARTEFLRHHGLRVIRFWNNEVNSNIEAVLSAIAAEL